MKKKPCSKACFSCPFRETNHEEFSVVVKALSKHHGQPEPDFFQILTIRRRVVDEAVATGMLLCHSAVYDKGMNANPEFARECAGLIEHLAAKDKKRAKAKK